MCSPLVCVSIRSSVRSPASAPQYSHHVFILFFIFLFTHGKKGLNPGFWKYIIAPGALYLLERLFRIWRANEKVVILSCTVMDDVFSLEFAKEGVFAAPYAEGQYIFLNSPAISAMEWHPFTISSAPQEKTVTVHIRVSVEGSWTKELCAYVTAMGPKGKPYFALDRQGPQGKLAGKILGPDGKPMLCIDGPHSGQSCFGSISAFGRCALPLLRQQNIAIVLCADRLSVCTLFAFCLSSIHPATDRAQPRPST